MALRNKVRDYLKKKAAEKEEKKGIRQNAFSKSLKGYYMISDEIKSIDKEIIKLKSFLKNLRQEERNIDEFAKGSKVRKAEYSHDLYSSKDGVSVTLKELQEKKKKLLKQQKNFSKIIKASKKGKNATIHYLNDKKEKVYFK